MEPSIHHRIDDEYLQNYLIAYIVKFNTRYFFNTFDSFLSAEVKNGWNDVGETIWISI